MSTHDQNIADACERRAASRSEEDYSQIVAAIAAILQLPQLRVLEAWEACYPHED